MIDLTEIERRSVALPPILVRSREHSVRADLAASGIDALIVTARANVRWLTGFTGSAGFVVLTSDDIVLITDGRYADQAADQLVRAGSSARAVITSAEQREAAIAAAGGSARIGLEADHVTWSTTRRYTEEWFDDRIIVPTVGMVERHRRSKDDAELARMELAALIADAALEIHRRELLERPTESAFANALDSTMRALGATATSFETIVASGPNGAMPHARPTDRTIVDGDLVVVDFGCIVDGYCSDMTRTVIVGEPDEVQARMLTTVIEANAAGVAAVRAGAPAADVDVAARSVIEAAGWGSAFSHGTGHGVGLDIHEAPRLGSTSTDVLELGDVVTVEPGVYLPAHGGVRIEDSVVVTSDGCRVLSRTTKSPTF